MSAVLEFGQTCELRPYRLLYVGAAVIGSIPINPDDRALSKTGEQQYGSLTLTGLASSIRAGLASGRINHPGRLA